LGYWGAGVGRPLDKIPLSPAAKPSFDLIGISGHTLKHLAAAVSTMYFVQLFGRRYWGAIFVGKRVI
jgi:hypothetical protein